MELSASAGSGMERVSSDAQPPRCIRRFIQCFPYKKAQPTETDYAFKTYFSFQGFALFYGKNIPPPAEIFKWESSTKSGPLRPPSLRRAAKRFHRKKAPPDRLRSYFFNNYSVWYKKKQYEHLNGREVMQPGSQKSVMERVAALIVDKRNIVFFLFALAALFCAVSRNWVQVNDDLTDYLPADTETRQGIELMEREFTTFGTAQVMVENLSLEQAQALCGQIEAVPGVKSVDFDESEKHYASASALFSVTFEGGEEDQVSVDALARIREDLKDYDLHVSSEVGNPLKAIIDSEMLVVDIIAVIIIVAVLLLTSKTYAEIPVLLITFGAAAILNMGTNFLMGEISFVTNSIAIVLQLALAIDYAIILFHRYMEEHETKPPREASISALSKAIPEISASSLTTISGLLALSFMQFRLGYDMGTVLIKAIVLSMSSVFFLMPGLLVLFSGWIDKSHHRNFVPKINFLGRAVYATRFVMPVLFILVVGAAFYGSRRVNYVYSQSSIHSFRQNEAQIADIRIRETFGQSNQMAI